MKVSGMFRKRKPGVTSPEEKFSPHFLESEADAARALSSANTTCCFLERVLTLPPSYIYLHSLEARGYSRNYRLTIF